MMTTIEKGDNVYFPFKVSVKDIEKFTRSDEHQNEALTELARRRGLDIETIYKAGIFFAQDYDEFYYMAEEIFGITVAEMGINEDKLYLYDNGFIIPICDTLGRIVYYINYSYARDSNEKYIMAHSNFVKTDREIRFYGLNNFEKAMEHGTIAVVEGTFDSLRLSEHGIPSVAIIGTKINKYQRMFLSRFNKVVFIPDNDISGESAFNRYQKELKNVVRYDIPPYYEDVDDFGKNDEEFFKDWIVKLKEIML